MSTPATDSLTTIGEAVGLTREDMTAIWEGVKANQAKLDGCQRHDFVGIDAGERYGSLRFKVKFRCAEDAPNCGSTSIPKTRSPEMGEPKIPGSGLKDPPGPDGDEEEGPGPIGPASAILESEETTDTIKGVSGGSNSDGATKSFGGTVQCPPGAACDTSPYELRDPESAGAADPTSPPPSYGAPCVPGKGGLIAQCSPAAGGAPKP